MSNDLTIVVITGVISALASGLVGVVLSIVYYRRYESRQMRRATLQNLAANRFDLTGDQFSRALNETIVVFNGSEDVLTALRAMLRERTNANLAVLFRAMAANVGIPTDRLDDELLLTAFNIRK
jgi:hypothetical protein